MGEGTVKLLLSLFLRLGLLLMVAVAGHVVEPMVASGLFMVELKGKTPISVCWTL